MAMAQSSTDGSIFKNRNVSWLSLFFAVLLLMGIVPNAFGYFTFQARIPNGDHVPHPCKPNYLWHGMGHRNTQGGGSLNPFGEDFKEASYQWTRALCLKDSDGDGKTNGEELGDPECIWTPGQPPSRNTGLSHPGVCTPWDSATCQGMNTWVTCDTDAFECDAINDAGVQNLTIRFPPTPVPNKETTYFCQIFDVPKDKDYHLIATEPVIDNKQVMHHIVLFGCNGDVSATDTPESCGMADQHCQNIIGLWTVGHAGDCFPSHVGFRIGKNSYKTVAMQFHWNNPELRSDYTDSSGMTLFYTDNIRTNDAGVFIVGQTSLEIPPGKEQHVEQGLCDRKCTNTIFKRQLNVFSSLNHMHYLGKSQKVELFRNDVKVADLTNDVVYNYDSPVFTTYNVPIQVLPGDEIKTTCVYKSTSNKKTVFFGEGTQDEMCYGILLFYPADAASRSTCNSWKSVSACDRKIFREKDGCKMYDFLSKTNTEMNQLVTSVRDNCNEYGSCRPECAQVLKTVNRHPCFQGDVGDYVKSKLSKVPDKLKFLTSMQTCNSWETRPPPESNKPCECDINASLAIFPTLTFTTGLALVAAKLIQ